MHPPGADSQWTPPPRRRQDCAMAKVSIWRRALLVCLAIAAPACIERAGVAGKACNDQHPCGDGFVCASSGTCQLDATPTDEIVSVGPLYPRSGRDWNDHVANDG